MELNNIRHISDEELLEMKFKIEQELKEREERILIYYIHLSYEGNVIERYIVEEPKKYFYNKRNSACWDRSGYGGVYSQSKISFEHSEELARKCYEIGAGDYSDDTR